MEWTSLLTKFSCWYKVLSTRSNSLSPKLASECRKGGAGWAGLGTRLVEVTDTDTDLNRIDIGDIAERCVLEELSGHVTVEEVNLDTLNIDPAAETSTVFQITPSLKLTIEEEYKICELEASKADIQAMFENV